MKSLLKKIFVLFIPLYLIAADISFFGIPYETDMYLAKEGFVLGYSLRYRQAVWVAYTLTAENMKGRQVRRKNKFRADPEVKCHPVRPKDYAGSGYDKGHLVPAADMTFSTPTMKNSFLMTNISPQVPGCNRGIWKRVENQVRRWAVKEGKLYVITGPVFSKYPSVMGKAELPVPEAFYKVILDLTPPMKMIGFIVPNLTSRRRISSFAVSVDEVERITGYDFFCGLDDDIENLLEQNADFKAWQK